MLIGRIVWFAAKENEALQRNSPVGSTGSRSKTNEEARIQREAMRKELLGGEK